MDEKQKFYLTAESAKIYTMQSGQKREKDKTVTSEQSTCRKECSIDSITCQANAEAKTEKMIEMLSWWHARNHIHEGQCKHKYIYVNGSKKVTQTRSVRQESQRANAFI